MKVRRPARFYLYNLSRLFWYPQHRGWLPNGPGGSRQSMRTEFRTKAALFRAGNDLPPGRWVFEAYYPCANGLARFKQWIIDI